MKIRTWVAVAAASILLPYTYAAELSATELSSLLRSTGGRYLLSELGISAESLDALSGAQRAEELGKLGSGIDDIRARYLSDHPEDRDLFEATDGTVTPTQKARLRKLAHLEGLESVEFVRATDELRSYSAARGAFLEGGSASGGGVPAGMTPVTDQQDTLQCWAVTSAARADLDAGLKLSARFTVFTKTKAEVMELILNGKFKPYRGQLVENGPMITIYDEQGGVYADAVEAIKVYGAMPEEAYPGFPKKDDALFEDLNQLIKGYAKAFRAGEIDLKNPVVREKLDHEVTSILDRHWGKPPTTFEYKGKTYDPNSFVDDYLPGWKHPKAIELNYSPGAHNKQVDTIAFDGTRFPSYKTGNHAALMRALEETLRAGYKPVLQYKVVDESKTQGRGEIGFAVHGLDKPAHVDWNDKTVLDHYVLAIDAEWGADGHLKRLLIKNTWDTSPSAHFGFHWIEADYFSLFEAVEIRPELEAQFLHEGILKK